MLVQIFVNVHSHPMNGSVTLVVQMYTVHGVIEYKCSQVATPQDTPHNLNSTTVPTSARQQHEH